MKILEYQRGELESLEGQQVHIHVDLGNNMFAEVSGILRRLLPSGDVNPIYRTSTLGINCAFTLSQVMFVNLDNNSITLQAD